MKLAIRATTQEGGHVWRFGHLIKLTVDGVHHVSEVHPEPYFGRGIPHIFPSWCMGCDDAPYVVPNWNRTMHSGFARVVNSSSTQIYEYDPGQYYANK